MHNGFHKKAAQLFPMEDCFHHGIQHKKGHCSISSHNSDFISCNSDNISDYISQFCFFIIIIILWKLVSPLGHNK